MKWELNDSAAKFVHGIIYPTTYRVYGRFLNGKLCLAFSAYRCFCDRDLMKDLNFLAKHRCISWFPNANFDTLTVMATSNFDFVSYQMGAFKSI